MALEEKLDFETVSKNIHQYLNVKTSHIATFLLRREKSLIDKESPYGAGYYKTMQEQTREKLEKKYTSLGLDTKNKRGAYRFAICARIHLLGPFWEKETIVDKDCFEKTLYSALESGVESLKKDYIKLEDKCVTINNKFIEKVHNWLLGQVYSIIDQGKKVALLEEITISKEGEKLLVERIPMPLDKWARGPTQNTTWEPYTERK